MKPSLFSDEQLEWMWAVSEQLHLFDRHDALWISQITNSEFKAENFREFLLVYGVHRGHGCGYVLDHLGSVAEVLDKIFRSILTGIANEIKGRWHLATSEISNKMSEAKRPTARLFSMTSKLFWFYHPIHLTMFDKLARLGLELLDGSKIDHENFMQKFEIHFQQNSHKIIEAKKYFYRKYPYDRRIFDKYLWLQGQSGANKLGIIQKFRASLDAIPIDVRILIPTPSVS